MRFPTHVIRVAALSLALPGVAAHGQSRLRAMPAYAHYAQMRGDISGSVKRGDLRASWNEDGSQLRYSRDGKAYIYDVPERKEEPGDAQNPVPADPPGRRGRRGGGGVARGRQLTVVSSPDGKLKALYKDRNVWISQADDSNPETQVTTDGDEKTRIKYGTACWVYGEELVQHEAIWWSPDGQRLAFYRFDESKVPDYYLAVKAVDVQDALYVEPYPKSGAPNPVVDLYVYDLQSKQTVRVDARNGKPLADDVVGYYVYAVQWSPDGKELLFHRTNCRQNVMEVAAADPSSGKTRVIVREELPASWTENRPEMQFLSDGRRFIWASERNGYRNLYLYDLSGRLVAPLTQHAFEVESISRVDEKAGEIFYMARDGDNPYKSQLHRVGLDGHGDVRLTDPTLTHTVSVAPGGKVFLDTAEAHDIPPVTRLVDRDGKILEELAKSDTSRFESLHLRKTEIFTYTAADGKTLLYGTLRFPSGFDPKRRYPLLVSVYGGPESGMVNERFALPDAITELGFLVASFDGRGTNGRGKAFKDEMYLKMGGPEIDDEAQGVKTLAKRPYVDGARVGIQGTSYGGYASAMCLLRYPDVFRAASASSAVTDWRNYDSIYTERYMWLPAANKAGYDAGSCMTYAPKLKGALLIYYGTADDNVHPSNSFQLIKALQGAGKSFDVQVGPDLGHSGVSQERMLEFFIENLGGPQPAAGSQKADARGQ